jgi:hypothetical protein
MAGPYWPVLARLAPGRAASRPAIRWHFFASAARFSPRNVGPNAILGD